MADRRRGPRFARLSRIGTRVCVVNGDSMYRGLSGTVVEPDVIRTARLDAFNRRLIAEGAVLVERSNGALFVVPTYVLGRST